MSPLSFHAVVGTRIERGISSMEWATGSFEEIETAVDDIADANDRLVSKVEELEAVTADVRTELDDTMESGRPE